MNIGGMPPQGFQSAWGLHRKLARFTTLETFMVHTSKTDAATSWWATGVAVALVLCVYGCMRACACVRVVASLCFMSPLLWTGLDDAADD